MGGSAGKEGPAPAYQTEGFAPMRPLSTSGHVPHSRMTLETGGMPDREGTAELTNDPRFFTENVIDKRLAAFEAVAIVTEIMAAEAVKQCFELSKEFAFTGNLFVIAIMQLTGFIMMVLVMFMDLVACSVLSLQLFFTIRLMTAGPTGFDKAARFYTDRRMWIWRERAIFCVKWSIVGFMMSSGFMLCVKFYLDGAPEVEMESMHMKNEEYQGHKILAVLVLVLFTVLSAALAHLMMQHQRVFDESYSSVEMLYPGEMHAHLMTRP